MHRQDGSDLKSEAFFWIASGVAQSDVCFNKPPSKASVNRPSLEAGSSALSPAPLRPDVSKFSLCNYVNVMFVFIGKSHRLRGLGWLQLESIPA